MNDSFPAPHSRRPRYSGKNPRTFTEKYKELDPQRYPEEVAKVLASGKTPAGSHRSIMVTEILAVLRPGPGETAVDCTLGYGGHAKELWKAVQPGGRLIGLDVDPIELPRTEKRLLQLGLPPESLIVQRSNFAGLMKVLGSVAPEGVDVILADLGVSSMQIDDPARGFTFKSEGPLDMRMNPGRGLSAADWLSRWSVAELARILTDNGDEPHAELLAGSLLAAQTRSPLTKTRELAEAVRQCYSRISHDENLIDSAIRRCFQALRIAVNDEFGALDSLLRLLPQCLRPGGRVAILSFHSGEDRRVKRHFREGERQGIYSHTSKMVQATPEERRENPRSASAKLRSAVRSGC